MKKVMLLSLGMVFFTFMVLSAFPCQAQDTTLYGCAKKKKGQFRIVTDISTCRPSEVPVVLSGTITPVCNQDTIPDLRGTWSGTSSFATTMGFDSKSVSLAIEEQQGDLFRGHVDCNTCNHSPFAGVIVGCSEIRITSPSTVWIGKYDAISSELRLSIMTPEDVASETDPDLPTGSMTLKK